MPTLSPSPSRERRMDPPSRPVTGSKAMPFSCPATSQERHVRPSRIGAGPKTMSYSVYVLRSSHGPNPHRHRPRGRAVHCVRLRPPPPQRKLHAAPSSTVAAARHGRKTVPCPVSVYVPRTSRRPQPNGRRSQDRVVLCSIYVPRRHVGQSRTVYGPKTVPCSVPVYVPRPSRRPKPNRHLSQDHVVLCSCLCPKTVTSAQAEQSSVPRPCRALFLSTSQERHVGPSRTVVGPKTMSCSVPVYVPRTLRRPKRTVTCPKTMSCSVPVYVPRPSRRPKPNSRRSQDRAILYSRLRPKTVTSAQAEQSSVPRPCRALFLSTSQDRHVGPSRTVVGPKTVPCSIPVYVPRTSRRPKPNRHLSQDHVVRCSCLRPENVTSAQAEQSSVPRPCHTLFPSTSRERHVGPSRTVVGPKTVPYSIPVYVPRTSRRPKPNSHLSQDRVVLCSCLRPKTVTSAQAEQSSVPRLCRALFPSTSRERSPHSHRSQDSALLCFRLRPENVTSAQPNSRRS